MIKLIILDFDGVIIESANIKHEAFIEIFQDYDDVLDDIIQYLIQNKAISRFDKFKYIYENFIGGEYNSQIEKELGDKFSEIIFQKIIEAPFVKGAEEFLEYFYKRYPIYIASNTPQKELEEIIEKRNLNKYFKQIFGRPPGTKIEFIKEILKHENAQPNEAVYIGDMIEDYKIAKKLNVLFIGRKNLESFEDFNIPQSSDLLGIKKLLINILIEHK